MKLTKIKKADWVVIRMLRVAMRAGALANNGYEITMALCYLHTKYESELVYASFDLLDGETK